MLKAKRAFALAVGIASASAVVLVGSTLPNFGDPLPGLTADQKTRFEAGREEFEAVEDAGDGLGPVFNDVSCGSCHNAAATGGASDRVETRFGRLFNGKFDPMAELGGSLIQERGIGAAGSCVFVGEKVPASATIVTGRLTTPLFGLGLVDAVPDTTFREIAFLQKVFTPAVAGRPNLVTNLATSHTVVGKFGWKAQVPTLFQFSGDAYLNEMGITSPLFPHENCPQGDCSLLACDPRPDDPEDNGEDVQKFADFMTFLGAPPRGPVDDQVRAGQVLFFVAGCATCHVPVLQTGQNAVRSLNRVTFSPFSDFLLHDMGSLGDGIEQGVATGREIRTAPLWGVRVRTRLLHDGRATTLEGAINAHAGQGRFSRDAFEALSPDHRAKLVAFLKSL